MTRTANVRAQPDEFVGVIRLANHYIATYRKGSKKTFVSKHPEKDIKIAQATAILFAVTNNIPYHNSLLVLNKPIITVLKHGQEWFPAELLAEEINLLTSSGPLNLGGSQQEATNMARVIALSMGTDCIPAIGISLEK